MLTSYRRHRANCKRHSRQYRKCFCPIWVQGVLRGESVRHSLDLTNWEAANRRMNELEIHGEANSLTVKEVAAKFLVISTIRRERWLRAGLAGKHGSRSWGRSRGSRGGFAHRCRASFSLELLNKGVPPEMVATILGNTARVVELHYASFVQSRQVSLEAAVRSTW